MTTVRIQMTVEVDRSEWHHIHGPASEPEIRDALCFQIDELIRKNFSPDLLSITKSCRRR